MPAPPPSTRLLRAVAAERDQLERHRARMAEEAGELRRALARIERGLAEIDERRALLDRVAGMEDPARERPSADAGSRGAERPDGAGSGEPAGSSGPAGSRDVAAPDESAGSTRSSGSGEVAAPDESAGSTRSSGSGDVAAPDDGARLLRGPEIREAAVRVLVERGAGEAMHYREWFALLADAGHEIAGKDPLAVFLTQLGRSPAVRRGSGAGVYELDRLAAARLRAALERLQRELRELTIAPATDLRAIRARREQLNADIGRVERALEEIARVLGPAPPLAAAG
jgi:hypothetical protein